MLLTYRVFPIISRQPCTKCCVFDIEIDETDITKSIICHHIVITSLWLVKIALKNVLIVSGEQWWTLQEILGGGGVSAEGMSLLGGLGAWSINSSHLICDIRNVEYCFLFVFKQCHFVLLCCLFVVVIVLPFLKMKTCLCFHFSKRKLQLKLFGGGRLPPSPTLVSATGGEDMIFHE